MILKICRSEAIGPLGQGGSAGQGLDGQQGSAQGQSKGNCRCIVHQCRAGKLILQHEQALALSA